MQAEPWECGGPKGWSPSAGRPTQGLNRALSIRAHSFIHSLTRGVLPSQPLGTEVAQGPQGPQCYEPQLVTEATLGHDVTKSYRNYTAVSCQD